jgi:ribosomal protein S27AE
MQHLDGNAVAGTLYAHFGNEMTGARGACRHCGAQSQIAELRVYLRAPGAVARCPNCGNVVFVLVARAERAQVNFDYYELLDTPPTDPRDAD